MISTGCPWPGGQVNEPALREQVRASAVREPVLLDARADRSVALGEPFEVGLRDLDVEVARVREHAAVLEDAEVLRADDVRVAGDRHDEVGPGRRVEQGTDREAVEARLDRPDRIDLGDHHLAAQAPEPRGHAFPAPAVAGDDADLARDEEIRGGEDPVERRLAGPYRLSNRCFISASFTSIAGKSSPPVRASARRRVTPVVVSSVEPRILPRCFRLGVDEGDEVGSVVDDDVGVRVEHRVDPRLGTARPTRPSPRSVSTFASRRAATASSSVESGLPAASRTSAPPA